MPNNQPATPDNKSATPGNESGQQNPQTPQGAAPSQTPSQEGDKGTQQNQEGMVSISAKEYRDLQRAKARASSAQRREALKNKQNTTNKSVDEYNSEGVDPEVAEALSRTQSQLTETQRDLIIERSKNRVTEILSREEYKDIPESTKRILRNNPSSVASVESNTIDELMLDVEDFLNDEIEKIPVTVVKTPPQENTDPKGHETPDNVGGGGSQNTSNQGLEDISNLTGTARSRAVLRNAIKKGGGKIL